VVTGRYGNVILTERKGEANNQGRRTSEESTKFVVRRAWKTMSMFHFETVASPGNTQKIKRR
jgi:hypothetical protein